VAVAVTRLVPSRRKKLGKVKVVVAPFDDEVNVALCWLIITRVICAKGLLTVPVSVTGRSTLPVKSRGLVGLMAPKVWKSLGLVKTTTGGASKVRVRVAVRVWPSA
jgi:hypothetical protein